MVIGTEGRGGGGALDIAALTEDSAPDAAADYTVTYDASAGTNKKVLLDNLPGGVLTYEAVVRSHTPLLYWRLGEASGTQAIDTSGNGYHGAYVGSPTFAQGGALIGNADTAVRFDGSTQHAWIRQAALLVPQFTLECWCRTENKALAFQYAVALPYDDQAPWDAPYLAMGILLESGQIRFVCNVGGTLRSIYTGITVNNNEWYHLAGTYDGAVFRVYVNGGLQPTTVSVAGSVLYSGTPAFAAGIRSVDSVGDRFQGRVDEVALYSSALTAAQLAEHYAIGIGGGIGGSINIPALVEEPAPDGEADYVSIYDGSSGGHKKAKLNTLPGPYIVGSMLNGKPTASQILLHHVFTQSVTFPSGLTGSQGKAGVAATAQADSDITRNGSSIGTMRFAAAGTSATWIFASETTFVAGDVLKIVAPSTPDATLADLAISLDGTL